jgi:BolA protein
MDRVNEIRNRLTRDLDPISLEIRDDSMLHTGHAGAVSGGGHFVVKVVSSLFQDKTLLERHRMVYQAVTDLMPAHIHALSITANTPEEQAMQN